MWGVLVGLYIVVIIYPFIEEWQQKRANKSALANMRRQSAMRHQWDRTKGQWIDSSRALANLGKRKGACARPPGPYATRTP